MKNIIITMTLFLLWCNTQAQKGIGVPNPDPSSVLELSSTNRGFLPPRLTTGERDAIESPAMGLVVFNITTNCLEWYAGREWFNACGNNRRAVATTYTCNTASTGTMTVGVPVEGVTQTITADVAVVGSYNITATNNGVTFRASGNFTATGPQDIVLHASGIPLAAGDHAFTLDTTPSCTFSRTTNPVGPAIVSRYDCDTASTGELTVGVLVNGEVTQTITAHVTTPGSYNISIRVNGIHFSAGGTFTATGPQEIVLVAVGIPIAAGTHSYTLNTTPNCSFNRVTNPVPVGEASSYICNTGSAGTMTAGTLVSGVTQTITAMVTRVGPYSISATNNGVIFAASGTYTGLGAQQIVLQATGTPTAAGAHTFTINTTPNCSFTRETIGIPTGLAVCDGTATTVVEVTSPTGRIWMDRNLGASRAATSITDYMAFGCLYQWGRGNDGHASIRWGSTGIGSPLTGTTSTLSVGNVPGHDMFIRISSIGLSNDWRSSSNNNLWQGVAGINNPCPAGFRVPTSAELATEFTTLRITNSATGHNSILKLPTATWRYYDGVVHGPGASIFSTSTVSGVHAHARNLSSTASDLIIAHPRVYGNSVRCIKN